MVYHVLVLLLLLLLLYCYVANESNQSNTKY
jgi:hypothetical protein